MTWYICHVGALSKAEDILEWNMGLVLATARILFQRDVSRCEGLVPACVTLYDVIVTTMEFGKVMVGHSNLTPPFAYL